MKGNPGELILGRYRLEHPIGEGGFAKVYLGRQVSLDREVAIKSARPDMEGAEVTRERFRREALLVAGINHPNVVTYHDYGVDDDGDLILVLEHLRGMTLREILARRSRPEVGDVVRWMRDASAGLGEAHARGIVHRDVKPSNLFLVAPGTPDERLKVLDFGILRVADAEARGLRDLTRTDAVIGTPDYLAPEAVLGMPLDGRCDQYALTLVACELLLGRRPFPPANQGGVLDRLTKRPADLAARLQERQVPHGLCDALHRALAPAPEERFPTMRAFSDALVAAVRESSTRTCITSAPEPERALENSGGNTGRSWLWVAAALVLGLSAYGAFAIMPGDPEASLPEAAVQVPGHRGPSEDLISASARMPLDPVPEHATDPAVEPVVPSPEPETLAKEPLGPPREITRRRAAAQPRRVLSPGVATAGEGVPERGHASLTMNAQPWADVFVDGRPMGRTPLVDVAIESGRRVIEFRHPSMKTERLVENVRAGERRTVRIRLDPIEGLMP